MSFFKKIFSKKSNGNLSSSPVYFKKKFEEVSTKIFPYFKQVMPSKEPILPLPKDLSEIKKEQTYESPDVKIVMLNICEDLNCFYVIDTGFSFEIILESHLEKWNIDKEKLHDKAIENFRTLLLTKLSAKGDTNGIMFTVDGNLEAGLVLIDEIWQQLEDQIGESVVIAVPSRDVITATGKSNRAMIEKIIETSTQILNTGDHPLSKNLFIRENGRWIFFEKILD